MTFAARRSALIVGDAATILGGASPVPDHHAALERAIFDLCPALSRPAVFVRTGYQPAAGPAQPQMIVTEQVRRKKK